MTLPTAFFAIIGSLLFVFLLTAIANLFFYRQLSSVSPPAHPLLSVCIPARNEAAVIGQTIAGLLSYPSNKIEILVLDDQSTDQTAAIVGDYAQRDQRVSLITGRPLPAGWLGKNWACHQLGQQARGDLLLFTDADVQWRPGGLTALLSHQQTTGVDLVSVWPTQRTLTWSEWLVVPLMKFAILAYLPLVAVHFTRWPAFAAANGQALLLKKEAYEKIGGHAAVKNQIVEDVALARAIKQIDGRLRLVDGGKVVTCRMYRNWTEVRHGFAKNILAGHANSVPFLLLSTAWHWSAFVVPWILLITAPSPATLVLFGLAVLLRFTTETISDGRPLVATARAVTMPLGVGLMTVIAAQSIAWHYGRGPIWKGRHAKV